VGGGQKPVGSLLGELQGFTEDDWYVRPADLEFGEPVGELGGMYPAGLKMAE
jgi:hypothetical protein